MQDEGGTGSQKFCVVFRVLNPFFKTCTCSRFRLVLGNLGRNMVSDLEPDVRNARNAKLIRTRGQLLRTPRTGSDSNFSEPWTQVLRSLPNRTFCW